MMEAAGITEELKARDPMRWVGLMNTLKAQLIVGVASVAWMAALDEWYEQGGKTDLREILEKTFSMAGKL